MRKIKVGFDLSQTAHAGGVATYTNNLVEQLNKFPELEMVYFFSSLRKRYQGDMRNVKSFRLPPVLFEVLFNKIRSVNIEKFIGPIDIYHSSDWIQPPTKAKKVTTYHDLTPIKFPSWSNPKIVAVHKRRLKLVENEIDMVIAVSESTKKDLLEVSKIPEGKIVVVYEAADKVFRFYAKKDLENFRIKYKLPNKFVLAISGVGERRNLKVIRQITSKYNLIVAGEDLPYLSNLEMALLYNCASLLLYPSLYEGFGLPILEAFNSGLPVITSNVSSMSEIAGDGALLVDPKNPRNIQDNLKLLMEDKKLRSDLIKKGFIQAKKFSWEKTAKETMGVYQDLVSR